MGDNERLIKKATIVGVLLTIMMAAIFFFE
jgi:hypothetical protein